MAKEAAEPKANMETDWYCLAVHKNTHECTFEYAGAEKDITKKVGFRHLLSNTEPLTSIAYQLKQLLSYFMHRMTSLSSE